MTTIATREPESSVIEIAEHSEKAFIDEKS